jgi:hypothetical protein
MDLAAVTTGAFFIQKEKVNEKQSQRRVCSRVKYIPKGMLRFR